MLAEKFALRTDSLGRLIGLPPLASKEEVEIIVIRKEPVSPRSGHRPSPRLAYSGAMLTGDDIEPAFTAEEWGQLFQDGKDRCSFSISTPGFAGCTRSWARGC